MDRKARLSNDRFKQSLPFIVQLRELNSNGRSQSVEQAWKVGDHLERAKLIVEHGEFRSWLFAQGIDRNMSLRFMRLRNEYQIAQLESFGSVNEALKTLPEPESAVHNKVEVVEKDKDLTGAEKRIVERDQHIERIKTLEQEKQEITKDFDLASKQVEAIFDDDRPQLATISLDVNTVFR